MVSFNKISNSSNFSPDIKKRKIENKRDNKRENKRDNKGIIHDVEMPDVYIGNIVIRDSYKGLRFIPIKDLRKNVPSNIRNAKSVLSYLKVVRMRHAHDCLSIRVLPILNRILKLNEDSNNSSELRASLINELTINLSDSFKCLQDSVDSRMSSIDYYGWNGDLSNDGHFKFVKIYDRILTQIQDLLKSVDYCETFIYNGSNELKLFMLMRRLMLHMNKDLSQHGRQWNNN